MSLVPYKNINLLTGVTGDGGELIQANDQALADGLPYPWQSTFAYQPNQIAIVGTVAYLCIAANINQPPASSPTYWTSFSGGGYSGVPTLQQVTAAGATTTDTIAANGGLTLGLQGNIVMGTDGGYGQVIFSSGGTLSDDGGGGIEASAITVSTNGYVYLGGNPVALNAGGGHGGGMLSLDGGKITQDAIHTIQLPTTQPTAGQVVYVAGQSGTNTVLGYSGVSSSSLTGTTLAANIVSSSLTAFGNSPGFSGVPSAPTASPGTNTTQIASTAFVTAATSQLQLVLNSQVFS